MEGFDKSCKSGKKPKKDLIQACLPNQTRMPKDIFFNLSCTIPYKEDIFWLIFKINFVLSVCGKSVASAELPDGKELQVTMRACSSEAELGELEAEKCHEGSGKDLGDFVGDDIPESAKVTLCTCKGDKCNSSSMLKVTQASLMVLVIGFLTSKFMQ